MYLLIAEVAVRTQPSEHRLFFGGDRRVFAALSDVFTNRFILALAYLGSGDGERNALAQRPMRPPACRVTAAMVNAVPNVSPVAGRS